MTDPGRESTSAARTTPSGSGFGGAVLSLLGLAAFLALWQGIVVMTRPEAIRRVTLAFSAPRADTVWAVVLSERGEVAARERMSLDPAQIQTGAATLRIWLGSLQPTIAALPPDADRPVALDSILAAAQFGFGGGLDMHEVPVARAAKPEEEALERRGPERLDQFAATLDDGLLQLIEPRERVIHRHVTPELAFER